ncbi:hypothetical protein [Plantactinospora sp. B24E8]
MAEVMVQETTREAAVEETATAMENLDVVEETSAYDVMLIQSSAY